MRDRSSLSRAQPHRHVQAGGPCIGSRPVAARHARRARPRRRHQPARHARRDHGRQRFRVRRACARGVGVCTPGATRLQLPGKPVAHAYGESFHDTTRAECLDQHGFTNPHDARDVIPAWQDDYNTVRPHSALQQSTPNEYARTFTRSPRPSAYTSEWSREGVRASSNGMLGVCATCQRSPPSARTGGCRRSQEALRVAVEDVRALIIRKEGR